MRWMMCDGEVSQEWCLVYINVRWIEYGSQDGNGAFESSLILRTLVELCLVIFTTAWYCYCNFDASIVVLWCYIVMWLEEAVLLTCTRAFRRSSPFVRMWEERKSWKFKDIYTQLCHLRHIVVRVGIMVPALQVLSYFNMLTLLTIRSSKYAH